ncbi:CMRF35-like molecule 9 isoform X6 [Manis javanica]|uniref:CMRF35-like molecule 9 isoform X6 n=1 Tax=Manis javanica TaxID=9974 RepID=UPI00081345ED
MQPLTLLWGCLLIPGCRALMGPKEIRGFEGDTVSLQCIYKEELRTYKKYWCRRRGFLFSRCSGAIYVEGDGQERTEGRVSIQDRPQELTLKVTLRNLTLQDAGNYFCGVKKLGPDETFMVSLLIFPETKLASGRVAQKGQAGEQLGTRDTEGLSGRPRGPQEGKASNQLESIISGSRSLLSSLPSSLLSASCYNQPPAQGKSLANSAPRIEDLPSSLTAGPHLSRRRRCCPQQQLQVQGACPNDPNLGPSPGAADPSAGRRPGCPWQLRVPVEEGSSTGHRGTEEQEGPTLTLASREELHPRVCLDQSCRAHWAPCQPEALCQPPHGDPVPKPDFRGR